MVVLTDLGGYEKGESGGNVAKVRPQQQAPSIPHHQGHPQQHQTSQANNSIHAVQQQQQQQQQHAQQGGQPQEQQYDQRGRGQGNMAYNRLGLSTLPSPPSFPNQPPSLYQAFQLDGRGVTNPLYPAYPAGLGGQSVLLQSSAGTAGDIFSAASNPQAAANQFRLQSGQFGPGAPNPQQSSGNTVLLSQQSLMTSALKQQPNQIGPIGTKGNGAGQFTQNSLGTLPASALMYDNSGNPINYLPNALHQRSAAASGQTAFYQALAASNGQQQSGNGRQQQNPYGIQGFQAGTLNHYDIDIVKLSVYSLSLF